MYLEEVYLFTGNEQVIKKTKMDRILENVKSQDTDIIRYDLDTISIQDVITDCMTIPFLKKSKVIIAKNPRFLTSGKSPIKHDVKPLIKYLQNPSNTTTLIIDAVGFNLDKNSEVYKNFQISVFIFQFPQRSIS